MNNIEAIYAHDEDTGEYIGLPVDTIHAGLTSTLYYQNDNGYFVELPRNSNNEYYVPQPDLNMVAIELVNHQIENYYQNSRHMPSDWHKPIAQACIQQIINILQETL
jgi:hypothetical protein